MTLLDPHRFRAIVESFRFEISHFRTIDVERATSEAPAFVQRYPWLGAPRFVVAVILAVPIIALVIAVVAALPIVVTAIPVGNWMQASNAWIGVRVIQRRGSAIASREAGGRNAQEE